MNRQQKRIVIVLLGLAITATLFGGVFLLLQSGLPVKLTVKLLAPVAADNTEASTWKVHVPRDTQAQIVLYKGSSNPAEAQDLEKIWVMGLVPGVETELKIMMEHQGDSSWLTLSFFPTGALHPSITKFEIPNLVQLAVNGADNLDAQVVTARHCLTDVKNQEGTATSSIWVCISESAK